MFVFTRVPRLPTTGARFSLAVTAARDVFKETGLLVEIGAFLVDCRRDTASRGTFWPGGSRIAVRDGLGELGSVARAPDAARGPCPAPERPAHRRGGASRPAEGTPPGQERP
jgi:hypothetical protein